MTVTENAKKIAFTMIATEEGKSLVVYQGAKDKPGVLTVGIGHKITSVDNLKLGDRITEDQCKAFFDADTTWVFAAIERYVKVALNDNQTAALADFIFNEGETHFRESKLLARVNAGLFNLAAQAFGAWIYADGKQVKDLIARRGREKDLFLRPVAVEGVNDADVAGNTNTGE